jgi:hypothetical protein
LCCSDFMVKNLENNVIDISKSVSKYSKESFSNSYVTSILSFLSQLFPIILTTFFKDYLLSHVFNSSNNLCSSLFESKLGSYSTNFGVSSGLMFISKLNRRWIKE